MKNKLFASIVLILLFSFFSHAQTVQSTTIEPGAPTLETLEKISTDLNKISKSLQTFNAQLTEFLGGLNKYKGVQLSIQQQKLIFGYEVLNQTEQLAATLRKTLIETGEREATIKRRLGQIEIDLKPESIERTIQLRGTTRAEEVRESRRRMLEEERDSLRNLLAQIVESRNQISDNLRQTEMFMQNFRRSFFTQLTNELSNF